MQHQASYVQLGFLACTGAEARARYGDIPWLGDELVVVSDAGEVWVGPAGLQGRHLLVGPVSAPCPKPRR
jgi:hypothetical protein